MSDRGRAVDICIPPALAGDVLQMAEDNFHPARGKAGRKVSISSLSTDSLDDLSEIADFARVNLEEPVELPLSKTKRAACQALLDRTHRYAVLEPLGEIHCLAVQWRDVPLKGSRGSRIANELRQASSGLHWFKAP